MGKNGDSPYPNHFDEDNEEEKIDMRQANKNFVLMQIEAQRELKK